MTVVKNICIWGDSITYGAWDEQGGWADRLRQFLHERMIVSGFKDDHWVYNLGIPGDTTRGVLERFAVECEARDPDLSIFAIGINDAQRDSGISEEEFRENLESILRQGKASAEKIFFVGLTRVEEAKTTPFNDVYFTNDRIACFDAIVRQLCARHDIHYIPMDDLVGPADLADGLHPNAQGHQKMFERVRDTLATEGML